MSLDNESRLAITPVSHRASSVFNGVNKSLCTLIHERRHKSSQQDGFVPPLSSYVSAVFVYVLCGLSEFASNSEEARKICYPDVYLK